MARTNWKAQYEALNSQYQALRAAYAAKAIAPKTACVVYVDAKPFYSALTHSEAYRVMTQVKARGHRAMYRPMH